MKSKTIALLGMLAICASVALTACGGDDDSGDGNAPVGGGGGYGGGSAARGEDEPPPKPTIDTIVVRDGAPVGGPAELEYDAGEEIRFRVRSNVADELHVHGYDVTRQLPAGRPITVSFPADLEGIYEAELHGSGELIAEIRVNP